MIDGQRAEGAEAELAPLAGGRALLEHEHFASSGGYFTEKAWQDRVAQFVIMEFGSGGLDRGVGDLQGRPVRLLAGPGSQEPHRSGGWENQVGLGRVRA